MTHLAEQQDLNPGPERMHDIAMEILKRWLTEHDYDEEAVFNGDLFCDQHQALSELLVILEGAEHVVWMHPGLIDVFRELSENYEAVAQELGSRICAENLANVGQPQSYSREEIEEMTPKILRCAREMLRSIPIYLETRAETMSRSQEVFDGLRTASRVADPSVALSIIDAACGDLDPGIVWPLAARARRVYTWAPGDRLSELPYDIFCRLHAASSLVDSDAVDPPNPSKFRAAKLHLAARLELIEDQDNQTALSFEVAEVLVAGLVACADRPAFDSEIRNWSPAEIAIEVLRADVPDDLSVREIVVATTVEQAYQRCPAMSAHQRLEIHALAGQRLKEAGIRANPTPEWAQGVVERNIVQKLAEWTP